MNQVIWDIWNFSGVVGITILYGPVEPYFYFKEQVRDWEKQALMQMVLEAIVKTPRECKAFEFQAMGYHAYTYRLNTNLTLLVLTQINKLAIDLGVVKQLKTALQEDIDSAIKTFEALTKTTSNNKTYPAAKTTESYNLGKSPSTSLEANVTLEELLNALNYLIKFTSKYMGKRLTIDYWKSTRPQLDWLENFEITSSAEISFSGVIKKPISTLQHMWIKEWAAAFIKHCSQIIQDLPTMIEQKGLDERKKSLLLSPPAS